MSGEQWGYICAACLILGLVLLVITIGYLIYQRRHYQSMMQATYGERCLDLARRHEVAGGKHTK